MTTGTPRNLIEGRPVPIVIDIQGGESTSDEPSAIPIMPGYGEAMDRAPALVAKARRGCAASDGVPADRGASNVGRSRGGVRAVRQSIRHSDGVGFAS